MATNKHTSSTATRTSTSSSGFGVMPEKPEGGQYVDDPLPLPQTLIGTRRSLDDLILERDSLENSLKELNKIIAKRLIDLEL